MGFKRFLPFLLISVAALFAGSEAIAQAMQQQKDQKEPKEQRTIQQKKGTEGGIQTQPKGTWWFQGSATCNNKKTFANGDSQTQCEDNLTKEIAVLKCTGSIQRTACVGRDVGPQK